MKFVKGSGDFDFKQGGGNILPPKWVMDYIIKTR